MTARFPLYAKIVLWFFLNLLLLAVAFYVLFRAQFRFGLDWLLSGSANQRIEALSDLIASDLKDRPQSEWDAILRRFDSAYGIQFFLFRADGVRLAGEMTPLPPPVRERLMEPRARQLQRPLQDDGRRGPPALRGPRDDGTWEPPARERRGPGLLPRRGPDPERGLGFAPGSFGGLRGPHPKFMMHTSDPSRYWVLVRLLLNEAERERALPVTLVALSNTLSGGGLFFDARPWLTVGLGAVVFSALLWFPLVRGITRSIAQLTEATRQIADGRFDVRVNEFRRDELGSLGRAVNQMASRLAGFVTGQKRFLGDVAHELCSPLARLQIALGILEQRADDKQKPYVDAACDKAEHIASLVNELLSFSKASLGPLTVKLEPVSIRQTIEKTIQRETTDAVSIQIEMHEDLHALAEPELLLRALSNLVRNAVRYAGAAGPITVSANRENRDILLRVADCGPGVAEAELPRIFDPFYRLDASRDRGTGGVGLGLAIVKTCIESCRGTVVCQNRQPSGLEVMVRLPAVAPTLAAHRWKTRGGCHFE